MSLPSVMATYYALVLAEQQASPSPSSSLNSLPPHLPLTSSFLPSSSQTLSPKPQAVPSTGTGVSPTPNPDLTLHSPAAQPQAQSETTTTNHIPPPRHARPRNVNALRALFEPPPPPSLLLDGHPGDQTMTMLARAGGTTVKSEVRKAQKKGNLQDQLVQGRSHRLGTKDTANHTDRSPSTSTWTEYSIASSPASSVSSLPSSDGGDTYKRPVSRASQHSVSPVPNVLGADASEPTDRPVAPAVELDVSVAAQPTQTWLIAQSATITKPHAARTKPKLTVKPAAAVKTLTKTTVPKPAPAVKTLTKTAVPKPAAAVKTLTKTTVPKPAPGVKTQPKPADPKPSLGVKTPAVPSTKRRLESTVKDTTASYRARAVQLPSTTENVPWMRPGISAVTRKRLMARVA